MNQIDKMIQELCPEGVEWKKLGEVCEIKTGKGVTKKDATQGGVYPIISGGKAPMGNIHIKNRNANTVTISRVGANAGFVDFQTTDFYLNDKCFSVIPFDKQTAEPKYLYYSLSAKEQQIMELQSEGGVPTINIKNLGQVEVPLPPLPIQRRIVEILDKFTELEAELEAELDCRKRQYEYYRNQLLTFANGGGTQSVTWKKMSEIGTIFRGTSFQKKHFVESGVPCIHYGQIYTHYGTAATETISFVSEETAKNKTLAKKGDLIIATTSENLEDVGKATVWLGNKDIVVSNDACFFRHQQNPKYIAYIFQSKQFFDFKRRNCTGTKVIRINPNTLLDFSIPIPPMQEQERIANILDRFEALTTDLQSGLPAEIAARRQQYEYYRNQLLTFDKKTA